MPFQYGLINNNVNRYRLLQCLRTPTRCKRSALHWQRHTKPFLLYTDHASRTPPLIRLSSSWRCEGSINGCRYLSNMFQSQCYEAQDVVKQTEAFSHAFALLGTPHLAHFSSLSSLNILLQHLSLQVRDCPLVDARVKCSAESKVRAHSLHITRLHKQDRCVEFVGSPMGRAPRYNTMFCFSEPFPLGILRTPRSGLVSTTLLAVIVGGIEAASPAYFLL